jgi:hypothetical protein
MLAVVLLVGSGDTFQAETRPVSGVVGFETGLHLLASFDALHRTAPVGVFWGDGTQSPGLVQCPEERTRCNVYGTHAYPEAGHYTIEISYRRPGLFTPRESVFSTAEISAVGDFVILSIGDSVASGEGLPDVNYLSRSHSEPNQGFWQDPASNYSPVDLPTPLVPEDNELRVPCHRSAAAGPALAARQVGATNPVTFVHLACSGAVVFHTFSPAEPSEETRRGALDRQLRVARQRLDRIDVLLISGGANNMTFRKRGPLGFHNGTIGVGFGSVVTRCFNPAKWPCSGDEEFRQDISDSIEGNAGRTETDDDGVVYSFPGLDRLYADLDSVIHCINPQDGSPEKNCTDKHIPKLVLITEFFDPTHDQHGEFPSLVNCPEDVTIGPREWEYLHESVVKRLNHHVRTSPWKAVVGMEAEFLKHGYCAQGDRWVLRLGDSKATQNDTHGTGHPTSIGQDVYQRHIYHALIRLNPPITTAAAASEGTPYEFGTPAGRDVEVTLSARNPVRESAVGRTFYSVNRADCAPGSLSGCTLYTEPFVLSASGTYTIRFFSENASGQGWERVQSVDVRIDRAAAGGCTTIQPGPSWVCVDGGWLPPDHPLAGPAPPPAACTTPQPAPHWVCVNGGWVPPDHPLARGGSG